MQQSSSTISLFRFRPFLHSTSSFFGSHSLRYLERGSYSYSSRRKPVKGGRRSSGNRSSHRLRLHPISDASPAQLDSGDLEHYFLRTVSVPHARIRRGTVSPETGRGVQLRQGKNFVPEAFWLIAASVKAVDHASQNGNQVVKLKWARNHLFDKLVTATLFSLICKEKRGVVLQ